MLLFKSFLLNSESRYLEDADGGKKLQNITSEISSAEYDKLQKDFPEFAKNFDFKKRGTTWSAEIKKSDRKMMNNKADHHVAIFAPIKNDAYLKSFEKQVNQMSESDVLGIDLNRKEGSTAYKGPMSKKAAAALKLQNQTSFGNMQKSLFSPDENNPNKDYVYSKNSNTKDFTLIDPEYLKPKIKKSEQIEKVIKENEEKNKNKNKKEDSKETTTTTETKSETPSNGGLTDEYFRNELALSQVGNDEINYTPGKKEIPIDVIMGMSMGLVGNEQAKNANIPLRTEEVSQAMKSYTAELADKVKQGLPVEVEAQMKGLLADAYQGGLETIVRASGGNRATVLGNVGQLEQAKAKGLVGIQVADYEAKDRAFAQYGQAIKYIDAFDARRNIANHGIEYGEAKQKQTDGKALATAGFSQMVEGIKYERENGPGSANDMYRSMLMQNMFGFDPKAKDDGTGTVVGTKSYYDAKNAQAKLKFKKTEETYSRYKNLNPTQKAAMDNFTNQNKDQENMNSFMDHLESGVDVDPTKMNMENLDTAIKDGNYGLLTNKTAPVLPKGLPTPPVQLIETENQPAGLLSPIKPITPIEQERPPEGEGGFGGEHSIPPLYNPNEGLGPVAIPEEEKQTFPGNGLLNPFNQ